MGFIKKMMEARLSSVSCGLPRVKGVIAEALEAQCGAEAAGLRENMSQTVTKVERCHRSRAEQKRPLASSHARPRVFHLNRKARFLYSK